jgi:uncharacterized membrane protein HdeD (DUF308 family)
MIIESFIDDQNSYWWFTIAVGAVALISNGIVFFFPFKEDI